MIAVINLETLGETGNKRISHRFAAECARVESFNRHMVQAMAPWRTALWEPTPYRLSTNRIYLSSAF